MYFRSEFNLSGWNLPKEQINFRVDFYGKILRLFADASLLKDKLISEVFWELAPDARQTFEDIINGCFTPPLTEFAPNITIDENGAVTITGSMPVVLAIEGKTTVQYAELPHPCQLFFDEVSEFLYDKSKQMIQILAWYYKSEGIHNPLISSRPFLFCSLDEKEEKNWIPIASHVHAVPAKSDVLPFSGKDSLEIGHVLQQCRAQVPIGHELLNEAQRVLALNRRSAIVIGVAAAEASTKQYIMTVAPDTQWLIEHLPSPSLDDLIKKYLPKLPTKIEGKSFDVPPASLMKNLVTGVQIRNKIVHLGRPLTGEHIAWVENRSNIERLLKNINDLLYILDYYSGYEWALSRVSSEVRTHYAKPPAAREVSQ